MAFIPVVASLLAASLAIHFEIFVPVIPFWTVYLWMVVGGLGALLIPIPFLLALPAAAVRDYDGLLQAWRLLRGNLTVLAVAVIAVLFMWGILSSPMYMMAFMGVRSPLAFLGVFVELATLPVWASVLSLIYLRLRPA